MSDSSSFLAVQSFPTTPAVPPGNREESSPTLSVLWLFHCHPPLLRLPLSSLFKRRATRITTPPPPATQPPILFFFSPVTLFFCPDIPLFLPYPTSGHFSPPPSVVARLTLLRVQSVAHRARSSYSAQARIADTKPPPLVPLGCPRRSTGFL